MMNLSMPRLDLPSPLLEALEPQDKVFAQAFSILHEAITQRTFPAASLASPIADNS